MNAIPSGDTVLVRRAAERIHRFDIEAVAARLQFDPSFDECRHHDLVSVITRRKLVHTLVVAAMA